MALWFLRGLRRGIVTTRYPAATDAWSETLPSPPAFRAARLTSELADRLASVCPAQALRREAGVLVLDVGACTGCGRCVEAGADVVVPSGVWELATHDRSALVKRIPIRGASQ